MPGPEDRASGVIPTARVLIWPCTHSSCASVTKTWKGKLTHSAEALDDHGHPLSTSHTHGFEAEGLISSLEAVEQRGHDAGTGHSVGVPQGDRSAVDIELLPRDPQM